ncbi:transporter substrate-binding domain-containing protein [Chitinivorax sp. B]|uniref:substrate-binding periplasmic protein n=1 Tax=Chitinivorax sp. B TaxID=2502235 RepID=UPI001484FA40|nr:transporter substrate-binding domain-containing protein [Chitinivorax sp. B]
MLKQMGYILIAIGWLVCATTYARDIVISTGEYAPWATESSPNQGYVNRVVKTAFERVGVNVQFRYAPWKRALEEVRQGNVQASSFWFTDPDRAKEFLYSKPISEHREMLFHLKATSVPTWKQLSDLAKLRIGATRGYTYTKAFWDAAQHKTLTIDEAPSDELNFRKLFARRIDVFPMDEFSGWQLLSSGAFPPGARDLMTTNPKPFSSRHGHLIARKTEDGRILIKLFDQGLAQLQADGTLDRFKDELFTGKSGSDANPQ